MKTIMDARKKGIKAAALSLGRIGLAAAMVIGIGALPAPAVMAQSQAQDAATLPTQNVTITLSNAPVRVALDALFKSANLNYTIDPSIQQSVTVNLRNVPFDVALRSILRSTTPALQYTVTDGVYKITQPTADTSPQASLPTVAGFNPAGTANPPAAYGPNSNVGTGGSTKQAVVIYLNYINGQLLNTVVGPVVEIPPALTTPGLNSGGGGIGGIGGGIGRTGTTGSMGGMGGGMGGFSGGGRMGY